MKDLEGNVVKHVRVYLYGKKKTKSEEDVIV